MDVSESVLPIVRDLRGILLPHYGNVEVEARKSEMPHDVVTKLDLEVERLLTDRLREIYPTIPFSGEEYGGATTAEKFWLCDPIDGTAHFVRGLPFCTTMLALIEDGVVTFSVVYDFVNDLMYHALRGGGAFCNGAPMQVSERLLKDAYLSWESHIEKKDNLDRFMRLREKAGTVKFMNCGHELAMIASGKIEARVTFDPYGHDWDYAPGSLLVEEAGGVVANLGTHSYDYRNHNFIAANKQTFAELTGGADAIFPIIGA